MSLRAFHMLFIALSVALSAAVAAWGVRHYLATGESGSLVLSGFFVVAGLTLVVYGSRYFRKLKELG